MLKFLKYIFLIFGSIAFIIMLFFFWNNKHDVTTAFEYRNQLSYDGLKQTCVNVQKDYYYPCLRERFADYAQKVSLTGISIGLKFVFDTLDDDKENVKFFQSEKIRDLHYSINYLEINNIVIENAYKRFFGFNLDFSYSHYIIRMRDHYENAYKFSDNLLIGLKGDEGISSVKDPVVAQQLVLRLEAVEAQYKKVKNDADKFIQLEVDKQEKKYQEYLNSK